MFVTRAEEEKTRAIQEAISTLMKRHRAEMRDDAKEAAKEAREGFKEELVRRDEWSEQGEELPQLRDD